MPVVYQTCATLRFFGDDLAPEELTRALGVSPTKSETKGQEIINTKTGRTRIARTGAWRLETERLTPGNLEAQICWLLNQCTNDQKIWGDLTKRFRANIFCGVFMAEGNEGLTLSPATLLRLGQRNLLIDLDIYEKI